MLRYHQLLLPLLAAGILIQGCGNMKSSVEAASLAEPVEVLTESIPTEPPATPSPTPSFEEYDLSLMMVGDNLIHMSVVYTAKQENGTYDFSFLFNGISDFLMQADVKIINQETILAGNNLGFSGFPLFNSPTEVGDAIADAGFNVVLHATNHTADQGISGIDNCIRFWQTHPEILLSGIHLPYEADDTSLPPQENTSPSVSPSSKNASRRIPLLKVRDVTFAILNYTYGPNYEIVSKGLAQRMELLCARKEQNGAMDFTTLNPQVLADIREADALAEVVVVCPHWGAEYQKVPSSYQESFALQMTQAGADLIIGTHPHVPQPIKTIQADNGNRALCYYSLGNYVSTQQEGLSMLEGLAWVTYHVTEDGIFLNEEKTGVVPLVCHYTSSPLRIKNIYLLEDYTQELAASHGIIPYGGISFSLDDLQGWSREIFGEWVLKKEAILP